MSIIYAVKVEIDPADEYTWDEWNTRQHVPEVLAEPGFLRATKYKLDTPDGEWSQYLILYELDSRESLEAYLNGDAVIRLRADHYAHFGTSSRLSRLILTPVASIDKPEAEA
jgi:quinol monooxygenase YgiN